ncbi:hypothetical protein Aperf_G00000019148 [Anoplocephala perfoliata]
MESASFQLYIVSADQRLPSQTVEVEAKWTAIDLKRHLSKVYPGEPPIDSQKLIFAGRILSDNSKLKDVIGREPISRTVHLVLSPSVANQVKAAVAAQGPSCYSPKELEVLKQQYLKYLNDYYRSEGGVVSNAPGINEYDGENEVINMEIDLDEDLGADEESIFQRLAGAFGFRGNRNAPAPQIDDLGGEEQIDLFDLAYAFFRISILIAICVTYASWQRIALVTVVGLIFYWRNGVRQNEIRRQRQNPPVAPVPARQNQQQQTPQERQNSESAPETPNDTTDGVKTAEEGDASVAGSSNSTAENNQQEQPNRVVQIAQALRAAGGTSVRLVCAIFTSLVPELPARIE